MRFANGSLKHTNINKVCDSIIFHKINSVYLKYIIDYPNFIEQNCYGKICKQKFLKAVDIYQQCDTLFPLIAAIVDYVDAEDITDEVFYKLLSCQPIENESFIMILSHKKLSTSQLERLCDTDVTFECFYELAIEYYINNNYTLAYLKNFLERFKANKFSYLYSDLLFEIQQYKTSDKEKYDYVHHEVKKQLN